MSFIIWLFALISLSHSTTSREDKDPIPWALTLGPSTITASHWHTSGNITIEKFAADSSYKDYLDSLISYHGQEFQVNGQRGRYIMEGERKVLAPWVKLDEAASTNIMKKTINLVKESIVTELGSQTEPTLGALYYPMFFSNPISSAASRTAFPNGRFTRKYGFKSLSSSPGPACYAYGLHECEIMGTIEECAAPSPSPNGLTFVVEVEKAYIHLHLLSSTPQYRLFPSHRDTFNGKLGEISGPVAFGAEAYRQELQSFLQTFVKELPQVDREDIKAILGIGEGSVDLISELLEFLRITVGNDAKVYNTIDPSVVAAHGAALYARDTVLDPMYRELLDKDQHDEL